MVPTGDIARKDAGSSIATYVEPFSGNARDVDQQSDLSRHGGIISNPRILDHTISRWGGGEKGHTLALSDAVAGASEPPKSSVPVRAALIPADEPVGA